MCVKKILKSRRQTKILIDAKCRNFIKIILFLNRRPFLYYRHSVKQLAQTSVYRIWTIKTLHVFHGTDRFRMSTLYLRYVWEHAISDTKSFHTAWSRYYKRRNLRRRNLLNPTWANNCLDVKYWLGLPVEILDLCERLRSKFYPLFRKLCVVRVN